MGLSTGNYDLYKNKAFLLCVPAVGKIIKSYLSLIEGFKVFQESENDDCNETRDEVIIIKIILHKNYHLRLYFLKTKGVVFFQELPIIFNHFHDNILQSFSNYFL